MEHTNHILIVDDVQENINLLAIMLQKRGFTVSTALNGFTALEIVAQTPPDMILLDISMPEMDGFEVTRRLKDSPTTRDIPIIFLTAFTDKKRVVEGFDIGGVDYVTKPYSAPELFARIKTHLELKKAKDLIVQRNQELQILNDKLNQLNMDKDELLGIVAHDLKSPLSAIRGLADALVNDDSLESKTQREFQETILATADRMFSLIKELLSVNAIERGGIIPKHIPIDVHSLLRAIIEQYDKQAKAKDITLQLEVSPPVMVYSDEFALLQICDNFISNAIKFSPLSKTISIRAYSHTEALTQTPLENSENGHLTVPETSLATPHHNGNIEHYQTSEHIAAKPFVRIEVKDQGPGLSDEDKVKLFGKFQRLSARPTSGEHSTGLGLSITKKIADAIGANIGCRSSLGDGAMFFVEIPAEKPLPS